MADTVSGLVTDSNGEEEEESSLDHSPFQKFPLDPLLTTSTPRPQGAQLSPRAEPRAGRAPLSHGVDSEEEAPEKKKRKMGGNTVSSLVLPREEKWSKEKLREYVKERKGDKLAEFVGVRESRVAKGVARMQLSPSPPHSPPRSRAKKKVHHTYICTSYVCLYVHMCIVHMCIVCLFVRTYVHCMFVCTCVHIGTYLVFYFQMKSPSPREAKL